MGLASRLSLLMGLVFHASAHKGFHGPPPGLSPQEEVCPAGITTVVCQEADVVYKQVIEVDVHCPYNTVMPIHDDITITVTNAPTSIVTKVTCIHTAHTTFTETVAPSPTKTKVRPSKSCASTGESTAEASEDPTSSKGHPSKPTKPTWPTWGPPSKPTWGTTTETTAETTAESTWETTAETTAEPTWDTTSSEHHTAETTEPSTASEEHTATPSESTEEHTATPSESTEEPTSTPSESTEEPTSAPTTEPTQEPTTAASTTHEHTTEPTSTPTPTPAPLEVCPSIPEACADLAGLGGREFAAAAPFCYETLEDDLVDLILDNLFLDLIFPSLNPGDDAVEYVEEYFEENCISELPDSCTDLEDLEGDELSEALETCEEDLGPWTSGEAGECFEDATDGAVVTECLEEAIFG